MTVEEKLTILTDAAKYDVSCTSSGSSRGGQKGALGNTVAAGLCHSFSADGRCISLLKVLMTNVCIYDCRYCVNRRSHDTRRAAFTPRELCELTIGFYRRNYIEGLFLSSGVMKSPDYTCEQLIETLRLLREEYRFRGYIHVKAIPGADPRLLERLGQLCDRMSVNIELPSEKSLHTLCPEKTKQSILQPMGLIAGKIEENRHDLAVYRRTPSFVPAGQSTQMIVGATGESDRQILTLSEGLYRKYTLKRVFFSAYVPVVENALLPGKDTKPPLLREHRLYQADWLMRFYGFSAGEILDEQHPNLNPLLDPKCSWALTHPEFFPVEVNRAGLHTLLRVPGIGPKSARAILTARRSASLRFEDLKKLGVVLKRAQYFLTCRGQALPGLRATPRTALRDLITQQGKELLGESEGEQLSLFQTARLGESSLRILLEEGRGQAG